MHPIVIFAYDRKDELKKTIEALKKNDLAPMSELYVFADGPKDNSESVIKVKEVREYIKGINGFKKVNIISSEKNLGLATSVINGVTKILEDFEAVIVLEDDLITAPSFLTYMNDALNFYKDNDQIWSISGYTPIETSNGHDVYFSMRSCSWGWGTWSERWNSVNWEIKRNDIGKIRQNEKEKMKYLGNDLYPMLGDLVNGNINSWAVRWFFSQFQQKKFTVYPSESQLFNIGFGENSTHGSFVKKNSRIVTKYIYKFEQIYINQEIDRKFKKEYDLRTHNYIGFLLKRFGLYSPVKQLIKRKLNNK